MLEKQKATPEVQTPTLAGEELPQVYIDDVLMSLKYYVDEQEAHIQFISPELCERCENKICLTICPVGAYRETAEGQVQIAYQSCIECGSCRLVCPHNNIRWRLPRGGFGIAYKFG